MLLSAMVQGCVDEVAIHPADELDGDFLGANRLTLAVIGATAEDFLRHRGDHVQRALIALRLSLRKRVEVRDFRSGK